MFCLTVYEDENHDHIIEEITFHQLHHLHCYCFDNDLQFYSYKKVL